MIKKIKTFDKIPLECIESLEFNISNYNKYIELWDMYQKQDLIKKQDKFKDNEWTFILADVNKYHFKFNFNEVKFEEYKRNGIFKNISYKDFIISVKSFILYSLDTSVGFTLRKFLSQLKLLFNNGILNQIKLPKNFECNESFLRGYYIISQYFSYIDSYFNNNILLNEYKECYIEAGIRQHKDEIKYGKARRSLPNFETMFKFNDIIEDFIKTSKGRERERFFPIILWWKITTILPLRSHEFVLLPLECIRQSKKNYFLTFYRNNLKGNFKKEIYKHTFNEYYRKEEFPVNKEIADLIEEYKVIVNKYYDCDLEKRRFLFSYKSFISFKNSNKINDDKFFSSNTMNDLKQLFLIKIIKGKYNINIIPKTKESMNFISDEEMEYIQLMDTRHFAIMNMVYMGYEPSTIQRIVGHKRLSTSYDYVNHVELFTKCYTFSIARQKALEKKSESKNNILDINLAEILDIQCSNGNKRYNIAKTDQSLKKRVDGGFCIYDKEDMIPCAALRGNHKRCPFFISDNIEKEIFNEIQKIDKDISAEIQTLKYLIENKKNLVGYKDFYRTTINKIHSKVNNKAEILANKIMERI